MNAIAVRFQRLPNGAGLPLPSLATSGAAGMDLAAAVDAPIVIAPGARALIPTGFAMAVPPGYEAQVRPRSGLALKHGLTCLNSPGTIDADYRGEVGVILANFGEAPVEITRGMRIAQLVVCALPRLMIAEVDSLDATDRGSGGFGSTGYA